MKKNKAFLGIFLIIVSAFGYGLMPIISKFAYAEHMASSTLLFGRFSMASIFLWLFIFATKRDYRLSLKQILFLVSISFFGYTMSSITIFKAYSLMSGSIATLILFAHPVLIVLVEVVLFKSKISKLKLLSLLGCIIGLFFVVLSGDTNITFAGVVLSFVSSLCYGLYCIGLTESSFKTVSGIIITAYVITISAMFNTIQCLVSGTPLLPTSSVGWLSVFLLAVFSTMMASITFYEGIRIIGASTGTMVSTIEPVLIIFMSMLILKEQLTLRVFIGAFIIIASIILLSKDESSSESHLQFNLNLIPESETEKA